MKRYTGQQALYEAISRSRAKAKRRSIIERLRPETTRQEKPAPVEEPPQAEPVEAPVEEPQPVAKEPPRPAVEKPSELPSVRQNAKLRWLAAVKKEGPRERPEPVEAPAEEPQPLAKEPPRPEVEKPPELPSVRQTAKLRWLAAVKNEVPREGPEPPVPQRRSVEVAEDDPPVSPQVQVPWRVRPLQLHAGRIEVSVPYHIGVAVALVVVLAIMATFRIGQKYPRTTLASTMPTRPPSTAVRPNAAEIKVEKVPQPDGSASAPTTGQSAMPQGDHWIVLVQHKEQMDLEPVIGHFAQHGIELGIVSLDRVRQYFTDAGLNAARLPGGAGYLLVTRGMFSNPEKPGTDGYAMKQKIIEVGTQYRAPAGRETFAARRFSDAYGMKVR